jgi:Leucine-rich repeat (LRR) protein
VKFGKLQSLVELDLSFCSELGCLPDSIVDLSQLKTFTLSGCKKLENLPMEFEKLQNLVELDLFGCFELGCLPDSIVDLLHYWGARKWRICHWNFEKFGELESSDFSN